MSKRASGALRFGCESKARAINATKEASNAEKRQKRPCLNGKSPVLFFELSNVRSVEEWGLTVTGPPKEPGYMVEILRESCELRCR